MLQLAVGFATSPSGHVYRRMLAHEAFWLSGKSTNCWTIQLR
jgi:hypothetical protein